MHHSRLLRASVSVSLAIAAATAAFGQSGPGITTQPTSQTVLLGSNAVFSVVATGQTPLTYQWSKGGVNLSNGGHIVGATNTALTVTSVAGADVGTYRCVVTNRHGSVTSSDATLTVILPPTISSVPNQRFFPNGAARTLSFTIADPQNAGLTVTASSSDTTALPNANLVLSGSGANRSLTITPTANRGVSTVTLAIQNSFGASSQTTFTVTVADFSELPTAISPLAAGKVQWVDYDNDGRLDLCLQGSDQSYTAHSFLYHNDGNGNFSLVNTNLPSPAEWADFDNDGFLDIAAADGVYHNNGDGTFRVVYQYTVPGGVMAWGDFDNDGLPDIATSNGKIYRNNGNGRFTAIPYPTYVMSFGSVTWTDLNNDGLLDLVMAGNINNVYQTHAFVNRGDGTFTDWAVGFPPVSGANALAWGDYNNDGIPDLLISGSPGAWSDGVTKVFQGVVNSPNWGWQDSFNSLPGLNISATGWADYDNDGRLDFFIGGLLTNGFDYFSGIYHNDGTNVSTGRTGFSNSGIFIPGLYNASASWGDYDGDGAIDLAIMGYTYNATVITKIFHNDGAMPNTPPSVPSGLTAAGTNTLVTLNWNAATDAQQSGGLSYNVRIGTTPGGSDILSPMSDLTTGLRRIPKIGNAGYRTSLTFKSNRGGTYYWSVQAIDHVYAGSAFSPEQTFEIKVPTSKSQLLNVDFGGGTQTSKTGLAAIGQATNDFWNFYSRDSAPASPGALSRGALTNLNFADGSPSTATLGVFNADGLGNNGTDDPMYSSYLYNTNGSSFPLVTVTVSNLALGTYDFYIYGHQQSDLTQIFDLQVDSVSYGSKTNTASGWASTNWTEGVQYVAFRGVQITNYPATVSIGSHPGSILFYGTIAGLQIASEPLVPAIWKQPKDLRIGFGTNAVLSATPIQATTPMTNQWFFNGAPLVDDGRIIGANSTNLTISSAQQADAGSYSLGVANVAGSTTSSAATLTFGFAPTISQGPTNQTSIAASTIAFSVVASGEGTLTYQWVKDGALLSDDSRHAGTATSNLVITNIQATDSGSYSVMVSNPFGTVTSAPAVLNAIVPPTLSPLPSAVYAATGTNVVLTVSENGTTPFTNQWYRDGAPLGDSGNVSGSQTTSLTISNVQASDVGNYSIFVSNEGGTTNSSGTQLSVGDPPTVTQQPASHAVTNGDMTVFSVAAAGTQPFTYQWYFGASALTDNSHYVGSTTASLTITNTSTGDAGSYSVSITNAFGNTSSAAGSLTVLVPPSIGLQPLGRSVPSGLPTVFTTSASGTAPLYYQWQLNSADIPGATNTSYTVASVDTNTIGSYSVVVTNAVGSTNSRPALLTFGPVAAWGFNGNNQCLPPPGLSNVVAVAATQFASYALGTDGNLVKWGNSTFVGSSLTNLVAISMYYGDSGVALRSDGTVVGINRTISPSWTNIVYVVATPNNSYGLRADGTVVWNNQTYPPLGLFNVVALASAGTQVMTLQNDGTVQVWSDPTLRNTVNPPVPLTNIVAIDCGYNCNFAVRSDGRIIAWGSNSLTNVPAAATNVVAISVTDYATSGGIAAALRRDGTIVTWGTAPTPTNIIAPSSISNAVAVNVGVFHGLALVNNGAPQLIRPPVGGTAFTGNDYTLRTVAVGPNLNYQWSYNGAAIADATNSSLTLTNIQGANAGSYQVTVTNDFGSVTSLAVPVKVVTSAPFLTSQPYSQTPVTSYAYVGSSATFGVTVEGSQPMSIQWRKRLPTGALTNIVDGTNQLLVFNPVYPTNGGAYSVVISNAYGTTSSSATFSVQQVVAWGDNTYNKTNVPVSLTNAIAICGGGYYNMAALRDDGSVLQWGSVGTSNAPTNMINLTQISGNIGTSSAIYGLRTDGTVAINVASINTLNALATLSNVVDLEMDLSAVTFLNSDGTLSRLIGQPSGTSVTMSTNFAGISNVIALSTWDDGFQALRADGTVYSYGTGGTAPPVTNVVSVASSRYAGTFLKRDQTIVDFGHAGLTAPRITNDFLAIASSGSGTELGVRTDGSMYAWGSTGVATNIPFGLPKLRMIDGGYNGFIALCTPPDFDPVFLHTALNTTNLVVSSRNSAQWYAQHYVTHDGVSAVRSAALGRNTASSMRMLVTNGPTTVSFWWKVSSETNHDFLTFSVGGVPQGSISGDVDWQHVTFFVPTGPQMLVWTYSKDASGTAGLDAGFVDELVVGAQAPLIYAQPQSQTVLGGSTATIRVGADGKAPLTYRWFRAPNDPATQLPGTNFLSIANVHRFSSGSAYFVVVSNSFGSVTSSNAVLTVHTPQEISTPQLQPDGTFLITSRDDDNSYYQDQYGVAGFQAQYSTNLIDWLPVDATLSISNGYLQFIDTNATNDPARFYRVIENW